MVPAISRIASSGSRGQNPGNRRQGERKPPGPDHALKVIEVELGLLIEDNEPVHRDASAGSAGADRARRVTLVSGAVAREVDHLSDALEAILV